MEHVQWCCPSVEQQDETDVGRWCEADRGKARYENKVLGGDQA